MPRICSSSPWCSPVTAGSRTCFCSFMSCFSVTKQNKPRSLLRMTLPFKTLQFWNLPPAAQCCPWAVPPPAPCAVHPRCALSVPWDVPQAAAPHGTRAVQAGLWPWLSSRSEPAQCSSQDLLVQEEMSDLQAWCVCTATGPGKGCDRTNAAWDGGMCCSRCFCFSLCPVLCFKLLFLILL